MFALIEGIFSIVFGMIEMAFSLAWGAVSFVFGLLGGLFSLLLTLGGGILALALILIAIFRRKEYKQKHQAAQENTQRVYDVDEEEFTSFYDQFRTGDQE